MMGVQLGLAEEDAGRTAAAAMVIGVDATPSAVLRGTCYEGCYVMGQDKYNGRGGDFAQDYLEGL